MVEFLEKTADDLGSDKLRATAVRLRELDEKNVAYRTALDSIHDLSAFDVDQNVKVPGDEGDEPGA